MEAAKKYNPDEVHACSFTSGVCTVVLMSLVMCLDQANSSFGQVGFISAFLWLRFTSFMKPLSFKELRGE